MKKLIVAYTVLYFIICLKSLSCNFHVVYLKALHEDDLEAELLEDCKVFSAVTQEIKLNINLESR